LISIKIKQGSRCEQANNPCWYPNGTSVCLNSATCSINLAAAPYYKCDCQFGYFGSNCQFSTSTTSTSTNGMGLTSTTTFAYVDQDPDMCPFYAANGFCNQKYYFEQNLIPVFHYCPVSCANYVPPCIDIASNCALWVTLKLCPSLANLKPHPCPKSCGVCV
jgi:hypothetical protein